MEEDEQEEQTLTVAELYPGLTPEQQTEADYYLTRYVEVMQGIFARLEQQNLTESDPESSIARHDRRLVGG